MSKIKSNFLLNSNFIHLFGAILFVSGATLFSALPNKVFGATIYNQTNSSSYISGVSTVTSIPFDTVDYLNNNLFFRLSLTKQSDNGYGSGNINTISLYKGSTQCATYSLTASSSATRILIRDNPGIYYTIDGQFTQNSISGDCALTATTTTLVISGNSGLDSPTIRVKSLPSPFSYPYLFLGTTAIPDIPTNGRTQVIQDTFFPLDSSTTTSAVNLSFDYFISTTDVVSTVYGFQFYYNKICVSLQSYSSLPNRTLMCDNFDVGQVSSFATTSSPMSDGAVLANVYLYNTETGTQFSLENGVYQFAVGGYDDALTIFAQSFGSSTVNTALLSEKCSPISNDIGTLFLNTSFSPLNCLSILFTPSQGKIGNLVSYIGTRSIKVFPFGYITDFVSIVSTSTVGELPVLSATIPSVLPGAGGTITLELTGVFDNLLYATSGPFISGNATSTDTFYDITSYYWTYILYVLAFLYMASRIVGNHLVSVNHFGLNGALSDNSSNDDSYALKEYLYKNRKK